MPKIESVILDELVRRRSERPFQPFVVNVRDGRRLNVNEWNNFGTQGSRVVVMTDESGIQWTTIDDIASLQNLNH